MSPYLTVFECGCRIETRDVTEGDRGGLVSEYIRCSTDCAVYLGTKALFGEDPHGRIVWRRVT